MFYLTRTTLLALFILLFGLPTLAQKVGEKYFLRHSMIFFDGETPKATDEQIVFTERSICGFSDSPYRSPILQRGKEITIVAIDRTGNLSTIKFNDGKKDFEILVENKSMSIFRKAFDIAFARKSTGFGSGGAKNWKTVIKKFGFPIAKCIEDGGWFYILEFSPSACGSFDGCVIKLTRNGMSIYGYI